MPSVRTIGVAAFHCCSELSDVECGEDLETLNVAAFESCHKLERIVLPLKDNVIENGAFRYCPNLATVDLYSWGDPRYSCLVAYGELEK